MSPARAMPTVETVPEARDADQGPNGEQQREHERSDDHRGTEVMASDKSWLPSIKDDFPIRRHQTGSPQLHPLLKPRPRSRDRRRSSGIPVARPDTHRRASADFTWHGFEGDHAGSSISDLDPRNSDSRKQTRQQKRARLSYQPGHSGLPLPADRTNDCGSSSSDDSTPKTSLDGMVPESQLSTANHDVAVKAGKPSIPDFLDKLDEDAPAVGADGIEQSMEEAASWGGTNNDGKASPSAHSASSSSSSTSGSPYSDLSSERTTDTERSSSPERSSVDGDETPVAPVLNFVENSLHAASKRRSSLFDVDRYGTPEMPRGTANLPHIPVSVLTPRVPNQGHPKHLPRAEKLPLSGYELLASRISASSESGPRSHPGSGTSSSTATPREHIPRRHSSASNIGYRSSLLEAEPAIQPIYRRFKAMNHRLLLHLQDELSELEEQLHRLDTADTQTRRLQNRILPASRRAEALAGGELQSHKTEILAKIGFKLSQYNHAMSSFTATRDIPSPSPSDVNEYRRYLTHQPVTEIEARFLDSTDDLVTLAPPTRSSPPPSRAPSPLSSGAMAAAAAAARDHHYYQALKSTLDAADSASASAPTPASVSAAGILPEPEPSSPVPIPGTMHGNSWRTNRGHLRGSSSVSHSPSPGLGGLGSAPLPTPRGTRPRSSSEALTPRTFTPRSSTPVGKTDVTAPAAAAVSAALPTIKVDQPPTTAISNPGEKEVGEGSPVVLHVAIALAVAVLLPILTFSTIPGLVGRLIVVVLVGMSVAGSVVQSGSVGARAAGVYSKDLFMSVAVYTGVMAVVAGVL
ncbi:hypothetical protein INS49_003853 [Diaporthe citri]|uniref:uncharacterized protein n=1 Tax=Diaporthe citri TaxID=83186 RepID=UPI001C80DFAF|nr:uncharacterized protein INS49_003853 [Diaporthe citri]KAG6354772.1 hypothetical protein INS49_003853 [Diaporthe citri]